MAADLCIHLHPEDVAAGAALIVAAAGAVRQGGGLVAAWDYSHLMTPYYPSEEAAAAMLALAGQRLGCPTSCFQFKTTVHARMPELRPIPTVPPEEDRLLFEPALAALTAEVAAGAFGLLVSNGMPTFLEPNPAALFRPGVLRLHPGQFGQFSSDDIDVLARTGIPTLIVSSSATPGALSSHELLDCCRLLAARMAEEMWAGRAA